MKDTIRGLRFFHLAFILIIISSIITMVSSITSVLIHYMSGNWDGATIVTSISSLIVTIFSILFILLFLYSTDLMYTEREINGDKHSKSVAIAIGFLIVSVLILLPYYASSYVYSFKSNMTGSTIKTTLLGLVMTSSLTGFFYYIFISLFLRYMIYELVDNKDKKKLTNGFALLIISQVIGSCIMIWTYFEIKSMTNPSISDLTTKMYMSSALGALSQLLAIAGFITFMLCYQNASIRLISEKPDIFGAKREEVIYAEPESAFNSDKRILLLYSILTLIGIVVSIVLIIVGIFYYTPIFWLWWLWLFLAIVFGRGMYGYVQDYLARTRFRIYDNRLVPSFIPVSYAINHREYAIPYSQLKGMSLLKKTGPKGTVMWKCMILLDDGRPVELYGGEDKISLYSFLKNVKDDFNIGDYSIREDKELDIKSELKDGVREQLNRWGVSTKEKKKK